MTDTALPSGPNGLAVWTDYEDNWRKKDADFIQDRMISRFADATERNAAYPAPPPAGRFIYRSDLGYLEKSTGSARESYRPLPQYVTVAADSNSQVSLAHSADCGKRVIYTPTYLDTNIDFRAQGGVLTVDTTGVSIKTGAATAKLTTSGTSLVSSLPLSVPSITLTGSGTAFTAPSQTVDIGTISADNGDITNLSVTGTLTGGVINGTSGTIGGVFLSGNGIRGADGAFYGGPDYAHMRSYDGASLGGAWVEVFDNGATEHVLFHGTNIYVDGALRLRTGAAGYWYNAAGTFMAYNALVVYSTTALTAANYPAGTIWIS